MPAFTAVTSTQPVQRMRVQPQRWSAGAWLLAVWMLVIALGPLLARMHQIVHLPQPVAVQQQLAGQGAGLVSRATSPLAPNALAPQSGWAHALWAMFAHHHSLDCQALDQLAHAQAPGTPSMVWLAAALPLFLAQPPAPWVWLSRPWVWTARGPPADFIAAS